MIEEVRNRKDLVTMVNEIGFLPFFSGRIEGFSLEENISWAAGDDGQKLAGGRPNAEQDDA